MNDPTSAGLVNFVGRAKGAGITDDFIVSLLKNAGWSERRIFAAFSEYYEASLATPIPTRGSRIEYARDAFFYLLAFFSLSVWTCALGSIFYNLIDRWIPDALGPAGDSVYSIRTISWQIAGIVVAFPLFLFVTRALSSQAAKRPELLDSGVRKWLTNLALVIAAVIVVGDLVTFIATFLTGDLSTRFIWRVVVIFVLAGGVFAYYLWTLRDNLTPGIQRAFLGAACAAVALGLFGGFAVTGPPDHQRAVSLDRKRMDDLRTIATSLNDDWTQTSPNGAYHLPRTLAGVPPLSGRRQSITDPQTGARYQYNPSVAGTAYSLCATFDLPSDPSDAGDTFAHTAGRNCFALDASKRPKGSFVPYTQSL
jgi:hypothetical protein